MQQALRGTAHFAPYHRMLARALRYEPRGSRRINLQRALAVMAEVRAVAPPAERAADDDVAQAIRAQLGALTEDAAAAAPAPRDPAWTGVFLETADLASYRCTEDRRAGDPRIADRCFTTGDGICAGSAEWLGDDAWPVHRIVEARWLFPSAKAAKAYVEAPATHLIASGSLPALPAPAIGDATYAWGACPPGRTRPTRRPTTTSRSRPRWSCRTPSSPRGARAGR
jgi:hypothetical protein